MWEFCRRLCVHGWLTDYDSPNQKHYFLWCYPIMLVESFDHFQHENIWKQFFITQKILNVMDTNCFAQIKHWWWWWWWCSQVPRRLLKQVIKLRQSDRLILCTTLSCYTAGEVISTALYCKHWSFSPGERSELRLAQLVSTLSDLSQGPTPC